MKFIVAFLYGFPRLVGFLCQDITEVPFLLQYVKMYANKWSMTVNVILITVS